MININPARIRPQNRVPTQSDKQPSAQTKTYTAPIGGWVTNANLADQDQQSAVVLENFWPTETGIEPRGGTKHRVSVPSGVKSLFAYRAGRAEQFFAATDTGIYAFGPDTPLDTDLTAVVTGQKSGDYNILEMQTDGGSFLTVVNGIDPLQIFDGTSWQQVTDTSSPFAITDVDTSLFSHAWAYRNRQFFIQKDSMNAWYLGVNSVAGAATKLPLAGIFNKGGSLLFGATWSSDSGAGMDDRCVFATDQGEFAVFGGDPIDGWSMTGVYDIGAPLGRRAIMSVGGDLIIATKGGLIPISAALQKDLGELKLVSLSRAIEPDWRREAALSGRSSGWRLVKWESRNMAFAIPPKAGSDRQHCFVVNLGTGKWSKFRGWKIHDLNILGDTLYYGDGSGAIFQGDFGGTDNGNLIECKACFAFDHLSSVGAFKQAHMVRGTFRHSTPFGPQFTVASDFRPRFGAAPNAVNDPGYQSSQWDVAAWDISKWAADFSDYTIREHWDSVSAQGHALAVQLQITSGAAYKLDCELISVDLTYSTGGTVV
jgi:hypothetical protein